MLRRIITDEIAKFMVRVVEIAATEFYGGDRALTFKELNDQKVWHHFVEKYEDKCTLGAEAIADEIGAMLEKERPPESKLTLLNGGDTEFIRMLIHEIAVRYNLNYSVSLEKLYASDVCGRLSAAGPYDPDEMLEIFDKSMCN